MLAVLSLIQTVNDAADGNIFSKYKMIEVYGYIQKLMLKNEISDFEVIKDKDNLMHYSYFSEGSNSVEEIGERTVRFKENLHKKDLRLIYLMPPDKYVQGRTRMYKGLPYNYANETADNFLQYIRNNGIDCIDLRDDIKNSSKTLEQLFYKTDHHWRIETAFDEFVNLTEILKEDYNMKFDSLDYYTDKNNYNFITYENSFLGSMGRKVGIAYGGIDDFTLIYPKFKTKFSFYSKTDQHEQENEGRFEDVLINAHALNYHKDIYSSEGDKYASYLMGNQGFVHISNEENDDGLKVMFIKDSYAVPLAAFLSTTVSDVYMIDPRYYDGDILECVNNTDLDMVIMSFYPQDLTEEFFKF